MAAGHRRYHRARRERLLQDPRPLIAVPATAANRTVDHLKSPDLALRLTASWRLIWSKACAASDLRLF